MEWTGRKGQACCERCLPVPLYGNTTQRKTTGVVLRQTPALEVTTTATCQALIPLCRVRAFFLNLFPRDPKLATYTEEDQFDHKASEGFIKIFSLPMKTYYRVNRNGLAKRKKLIKK